MLVVYGILAHCAQVLEPWGQMAQQADTGVVRALVPVYAQE
jgi:hypothetical protein